MFPRTSSVTVKIMLNFVIHCFYFQLAFGNNLSFKWFDIEANFWSRFLSFRIHLRGSQSVFQGRQKFVPFFHQIIFPSSENWERLDFDDDFHFWTFLVGGKKMFPQLKKSSSFVHFKFLFSVGSFFVWIHQNFRIIVYRDFLDPPSSAAHEVPYFRLTFLV